PAVATTLTVTAATAVNVQVSPALVSLPSGGVQQMLVTANFSDGTSQNVTNSAVYTSSNPAVVTVGPDGMLHSVGTGTATVQITVGSATTQLPVTVTQAALTGITLTPSSVNLAAGTNQQFTATGTYTDGSTQDLTATLTWTSSAPSVATVNATGNVAVVGAGSVTITATGPNGVTGTVNLNTTSAVPTAIAVTPSSVTLPAGQTQQFAATATMSDGSQQNVTSSVWWSVDGNSAVISNSAGSNGLLSTTAAGNVNVVAHLGSVLGQAAVTVQSAALRSIQVTPNPVSLPAGTTTQLMVTGTYTDNSTANLTGAATWTSDAASVATVNNTGVVHATASGTTQVHATVQGISGSATVTTTAATLNTLTLLPASPSIATGLHTQLTARGTYTDGSTQDVSAQVQWSAQTPTVGTVSSVGVFTGLHTGTSVVTATLNGVSQSVTVTVTAAVLQGIAVQAPATSFALGFSTQLTAQGMYSDGSTQDLTSAVTWSSLNGSVGLVSTTGVASGLTVGNFTAAATLNGVEGTLPLTVRAPLLQSISVTPVNSIVVNLAGRSIQFTATGNYSDGSTQNITNSVNWAITSGIALGNISQAGRFSPLGAGIGSVTVTLGTVHGSTNFTVVSAL
ncbi:MAG: beta strand repeat-containing protein, partial [Janthinobacterium lividum]